MGWSCVGTGAGGVACGRAERQERTFFLPDEYVPLCPTRDASMPTELPASDYEIAVFENRFRAFRGPPRAQREHGRHTKLRRRPVARRWLSTRQTTALR
jgi:hypothetical protein